MARYDLDKAFNYVLLACDRLNKARNLTISALDVVQSDLLGWNFIKAHLYDKTLKISFESMLNEFIFTREDTMTNLDTAAGIVGKNLSEEDKIIVRVAYTIWKDWKETRNIEVD